MDSHNSDWQFLNIVKLQAMNSPRLLQVICFNAGSLFKFSLTSHIAKYLPNLKFNLEWRCTIDLVWLNFNGWEREQKDPNTCRHLCHWRVPHVDQDTMLTAEKPLVSNHVMGINVWLTVHLRWPWTCHHSALDLHVKVMMVTENLPLMPTSAWFRFRFRILHSSVDLSRTFNEADTHLWPHSPPPSSASWINNPFRSIVLLSSLSFLTGTGTLKPSDINKKLPLSLTVRLRSS